jgi:uncharacterized membrane protein
LQIPLVDFYTTIAGGENTKMNAQNRQNLREILKEVGSKSLLIIQNNRVDKDEDWELAVEINKLGQRAFKMLAADEKHEAWQHYANNRKEDLD